MKVIEVGFSRPKSKTAIFGKIIQLVQGTPFSHVYIKIYWKTPDENLIYQASGNKVNFETESHFKTHAEIINEFRFEIEDDNYTSLTKFICENLSKPYSMLGVIGLGIKILAYKLGCNIKNPLKDGAMSFFCSEIGDLALQRASIDLKLDPEEAGPKEVYEALLKYYPAKEIQ
jgi:hypothetical protein